MELVEVFERRIHLVEHVYVLHKAVLYGGFLILLVTVNQPILLESAGQRAGTPSGLLRKFGLSFNHMLDDIDQPECEQTEPC